MRGPEQKWWVWILIERPVSRLRTLPAHLPRCRNLYPVDVADADSVNSAFDQAVEWLGGELHVLAHPAAIQAASDPNRQRKRLGSNVCGQCSRHHADEPSRASPYESRGGGSIINFGSISGQRSEPGAVAYSAAKGAVHSWTRSAAGAWGKDGVRVNAILPPLRPRCTTKLCRG